MILPNQLMKVYSFIFFDAIYLNHLNVKFLQIILHEILKMLNLHRFFKLIYFYFHKLIISLLDQHFQFKFIKALQQIILFKNFI